MEYQSTLFVDQPDSTFRFDRLDRHDLVGGAWVDIVDAWLPEADAVFDALVRSVPWRAERRRMYDRIVDVPRLAHRYRADESLPHPVLEQGRIELDRHYLPELGEPFVTAGCCFYRDGTDSVAWHGDRIGRGRHEDTLIAIVSVGAPRRLLLRPRDGGPSRAITMNHGDLVVMGGSCQRAWDHCVPKEPAAGPRISVQFRPSGVL